MNIEESDLRILNEWAGYLSFKENYILKALSQCDAKIILVDKGNQGGGTSSIVMDYINRILGLHPIEKKNIRPNSPIRIIRFASESLPGESSEGGEIKNTIYPQFKKFFPPYLIKKDITMRRPAITVKDYQGGKDIIVEFVSYNQTVQSQAGVQRFSIYLDENAPKTFEEEQLPRLLAADGDLIIGLTPAEGVGWIFQDIYSNASYIYNSPTIRDYLGKKHKKEIPEIEHIEHKLNIAVIRAATDDNPTLSVDAINENYALQDEETVEIRRYGIFHQMSGVIYKEFEKTHILSRDEIFPDGVPYNWVHARGIDFHEFTPWACGWIALSDWDEAFIYNEYNPSPDRMVTLDIAKEINYRSGDYHYPVNLIDPWAAKKQPNSGYTVLDDLNRYFSQFRRDGDGAGGYWQTWDTKNLRGRDIIKQRLKNSMYCQRPFNNRIVRNGVEIFLPTLWVLDNCPLTITSFKNWRQDEWANKEMLLTKDQKDKPQQRYSHFPLTFECIFKYPGFNATRARQTFIPKRVSPHEKYMRPRS